MKMKIFAVAIGFVLAVGSTIPAQTVNVHGKISNDSGQAINQAVVELLPPGFVDTTASNGMYSLTGTIAAVRSAFQVGGMSLQNGVLQLVVPRSALIRVEIFDLHGHQLSRVSLPNATSGIYRLNLAEHVLSNQLMIIKASVGKDVRTFRYLPLATGGSAQDRTAMGFTPAEASLAKVAAGNDTLRISASGYLTKLLLISSLDTTANITLDSIQSSGLTLMTWADIAGKYTGSTFRLPTAAEVPAGGDFIYSSGIHAQLANGHLMVDAENHIPPGNSELEGEIQLPATLNGSAAQCIRWVDVTDSLLPAGFTGGETYVLGGLLELGTNLYFTKYQWYNGAGSDWGSLGYLDETTNKSYGMWQVSGAWAHNQRVAGYMSYAPQTLSNAGYPFLAGQEGTSGAANGRWGPNLFAIQGNFPTSLNASVAAKPLLAHPDEGREFPGWWLGDKVSSAVWIETKTQQAVVVFLYQQLGGQTWYGENVDTCTCTDCDPPVTTCGTSWADPYPTYKGFHATGYHLQAWIYNPNDLYDVFNGKRDPWSVLPAEKVDLITRAPGTTTETVNSFITGNAYQQLQVSYRNGRLIIMQPNGYVQGPYESDPTGYVIQLE